MVEVLKIELRYEEHEMVAKSGGKKLADGRYNAEELAQAIAEKISETTDEINVMVAAQDGADLNYIKYSLGEALKEQGVTIPYHIG